MESHGKKKIVADMGPVLSVQLRGMKMTAFSKELKFGGKKS